MEKDFPILYILMRSDLDSLNPGKGMAQACHAANMAVATGDLKGSKLVEEWESQTNDKFGTTITLDGGSWSNIQSILAEIDAKNWIKHGGDFFYGNVLDPTYPVRDGAVTHLLPLHTCAWVFARVGDAAHKILQTLELHP